jgi:hypothetical protein
MARVLPPPSPEAGQRQLRRGGGGGKQLRGVGISRTGRFVVFNTLATNLVAQN